MESERERLERLYAELGDEHLKDLADDAEDLTDDGRMALAAEMQKRGFTSEPVRDPIEPVTEAPDLESGFGPGIPGIIPSGAAVMEQALEHGGEERLGWVKLISLSDGLELGRACEFLDNSDVEFAIREVGHDAQSGAPSSFEIWVEASGLDLAQRVLREKMGFFPPPEVDETQDPQDLHSSEDSATLGNFSTRAEADEVAQLLTNAGVPHQVAGPETIDEEEWYTIHVAPADLDRGLEVASHGLGMTHAAE
jgi:hypothetical protein